MRQSNALLVAVLLSACGRSEPERSVGPTPLLTLEDPRIRESSGLAASPSRDGVLYTHNDSGNPASIFRIHIDSSKVEEIQVEDAVNVDWEDISAAVLEDRPFLFIGDIGDNSGRRDAITVYRVPEPASGATNVRPDLVLRLRYPDEPHNAETLMVHPATGDLTVVTKAAERPSMIFTLKRPGRAGTYTMKKVGELSLGQGLRESKLVTGGDIAPDSKTVVLRTYLAAYEFDVPDGDFDGWVLQKPRMLTTGFELGGEAIAYLRAGKGIVTSAEGTPCQINLLGSHE